MENRFTRTEQIIGHDNLEKLKNSSVAVFGVGGVGGFTVEALARAGIGKLTLIDNDNVNITNINRQIIALHSTVGRSKVEVFKERIKDINPDCIVVAKKFFFLPENADSIDFSEFDYIVDAIDTVSGKIELVLRAKAENIPIIC